MKTNDKKLIERAYAENPVIMGVQARNFNDYLKIKLCKISNWLDLESKAEEGYEEMLLSVIYLACADLKRIALNLQNVEKFLIDREYFLEDITGEDLAIATAWLNECIALEKETTVEVVRKPSEDKNKDKEEAPPN